MLASQNELQEYIKVTNAKSKLQEHFEFIKIAGLHLHQCAYQELPLKLLQDPAKTLKGNG
jgi:hypothetical protein